MVHLYVYYSGAGGDCLFDFFHRVFQFHPLNDFEREHEKRKTFLFLWPILYEDAKAGEMNEIDPTTVYCMIV